MPNVAVSRWIAVAVLVSWLSAGCTGPSSSTPAGGGKAAGTTAADDQCESIIASLRDTFQLERLGLTTAVRDGVARLNDWQASCAGPGDRQLELPPAAARLLSETQRSDMAEPRFGFRDGERLRDAVLLRSVSQYATGEDSSARNEIDRVVSIFEHVVRTIGLVERHPDDLPLTPYDVYLLGKGTAEDRAWIFAGLLREKRIDAVLIDPPGEPRAGHRLVGVLLDGQVYLFDARIGVPIPGADASAKPPATLSQVVNDPQLLRRLDVGNRYAYPLRGEELRTPTVTLMGDVHAWTARMQALQALFTGEWAMQVSEAMHDSAAGPGLWNRVVQAGKGFWTEDNLRLWDYSEAQLAGHANLDDRQQQALLNLYRPFEAYLTLVRNRRGEVEARPEEELQDRTTSDYDSTQRTVRRTTLGAQRKARLKQIAGDFSAAVPQYIDVSDRSRKVAKRILEDIDQSQYRGRENPWPTFRNMHLKASEDAAFWTAQCKFEQREFAVARDAFERYRRQYPQGGWMRECRHLLALSYAADGDFKAAISELDDAVSDDPEFGGYQCLIRSWRSAGDRKGAAGSGR